MHGLHIGARTRGASVLGVLLTAGAVGAFASTGVAQAATTITRTNITSPADPSYFYDSTGGAFGGLTVTGTTNSTASSSDKVDIDCYSDNGQAGTDRGTLAQDVKLDASGGFSTTVSYLAVEDASFYGTCQLRAVPAGSDPTTGLSSYAGPRVLLAYLSLAYGPDGELPGTVLDGYALTAPQLGAYNAYGDATGESSFGGSGVAELALSSPATFGDTLNASAFYNTDGYQTADGSLTVDGKPTTGGGAATPMSVSVSQDPATGDLTINEVETLDYVPEDCGNDCTGNGTPLGVQDDRTISQANNGHVAVVTDVFKSTDGKPHQVVFTVGTSLGLDTYNGGQVLYEFPGESSYSPHSTGDTVHLLGQSGTIYAYNSAHPDGSTDAGRAAVTYFAAPSGPVSFDTDFEQNLFTIPFTLNVPAGGSVSFSMEYAAEYTQAAFATDLATGRDLISQPTVAITSPAAGATESANSVAVTGFAHAATGVRSVSVNGVSATLSNGSFSATVPLVPGANTIQATVTANSGVTSSTTETVNYTVPPVPPAPLVPPPPPVSTTTPPPSTPGTPPTTTTPLIQPQQATHWAGSTWNPVARTGGARQVSVRRGHANGHRKHHTRIGERLNGTVIAGSAAVSYHFVYGIGRHLNHHTKSHRLHKGLRGRGVHATIFGLRAGHRYHYRLIATGKNGHARGGRRSFRAPGR